MSGKGHTRAGVSDGEVKGAEGGEGAQRAARILRGVWKTDIRSEHKRRDATCIPATDVLLVQDSSNVLSFNRFHFRAGATTFTCALFHSLSFSLSFFALPSSVLSPSLSFSLFLPCRPQNRLEKNGRKATFFQLLRLNGELSARRGERNESDS